MKSSLIVFLQAVILLLAVTTMAIMIRFPLTEGRASDLDLWRIYLDPLILYVYAASSLYFLVLHRAFRFFGCLRRDNAFTRPSVEAMKGITRFSILLSIFIGGAGIYIRHSHAKEDDPAGFLGLALIGIFICLIVAAASAVFAQILQKGADLTAENERLNSLQK